MTTVDPPARFGVLTPPRVTDIWSAIKMDRHVAITALVCATVVLVTLLVTLPKVADAAVYAVGVGLVLKALADFGDKIWDKLRSKKGGDNGSG